MKEDIEERLAFLAISDTDAALRADSVSDAGPGRLVASSAEFEPIRAQRGVVRRVVRTDVVG